MIRAYLTFKTSGTQINNEYKDLKHSILWYVVENYLAFWTFVKL